MGMGPSVGPMPEPFSVTDLAVVICRPQGARSSRVQNLQVSMNYRASTATVAAPRSLSSITCTARMTLHVTPDTTVAYDRGASCTDSSDSSELPLTDKTLRPH